MGWTAALNMTDFHADHVFENENLGNNVVKMLVIDFFILIVNVPILKNLRKSQRWIDKLIFLDCLVNLEFIISMFGNFLHTFFPDFLCYILPFLNIASTILNRLIPMAIVLFRYIHVCKYDYAQKRRNIQNVKKYIKLILCGVPMSVAICTFYFR